MKKTESAHANQNDTDQAQSPFAKSAATNEPQICCFSNSHSLVW